MSNHLNFSDAREASCKRIEGGQWCPVSLGQLRPPAEPCGSRCVWTWRSQRLDLLNSVKLATAGWQNGVRHCTAVKSGYQVTLVIGKPLNLCCLHSNLKRQCGHHAIAKVLGVFAPANICCWVRTKWVSRAAQKESHESDLWNHDRNHDTLLLI